MASKEEILIKVKTDTGSADKSLEKVKTTTKEINTEAQDAAGSFSVMGVSINSLKGAFTKVKGIAKGMFSSIKMGIASTGIGLLVLAVGALVTYFTSTKKGAEQLQVAFKAVGATIDVLTDRISAIGGAILKVFSGDFKGAAADAKAAVSGLGEEIAKETRAMIELTKTLQKVKDGERDFAKERAETNKVIAEARFLAEDETASYETRLEALKTANELEISTTEKALELQRLKLEATRTEVELGESLAEDLDRLAAEEVKLIDMQTQSIMKRKRLVTSEETLRTEMRAADKKRNADALKEKEEIAKAELEITKKKNAIQDELDLIRAESAQEKEIIALEQKQEKAALEIENLQATQVQKDEMLLMLQESFTNKKNGIDKKYANQKKATDDAVAANQKKLDEESIANAKAVNDAKMSGLNDGLNNVKAVFGEESAAGKTAAVAQATINTYQGASKAIAQFGVPLGIPFAALAVIAGLKQVQAITNAPTPAFASGGIVRGSGTGTSDSVSARLSKGETVINARSTRMFKPVLSAMNEAGGGVGFADGGSLDTGVGGATMGVIKAFVVTDDITDSQDGLEKIRQKATI